MLNCLLSITYGGLVGFIVLYGKEANLANPALFFLFNALAVLLVRPFAGRIYDNKGPKALLIPGAIFVAVGLILLSYATSMSLLFIAAFIYGIGYGSMQSSLQTWMIQVVSPTQRGMANGMFLNSLDLGIATGALLLGAIAAITSYTDMYRYSVMFMILFLLIYLIQENEAAASPLNLMLCSLILILLQRNHLKINPRIQNLEPATPKLASQIKANTNDWLKSFCS